MTKPLCLAAVSIGACGGATDNGKQRDPETLIQIACDKISSLQCPNSIPAAECDAELHQQREEAAADGCAAPFDAALACVGERLTSCDQTPREICEPELDALDHCEHPSGEEECDVWMGGAPPGSPPGYQQCGVACTTWRVDCELDASLVLVCTCTEGPKAGTTFTAGSCSEVSSTSACGASA